MRDPLLNYAQAAKRVGRSEGAIKLWRRQGMPMEWSVGADNQRERVVRLSVLQATFRGKLASSPVHQHRMRRARREAGLPVPPLPASLKRSRVEPAPAEVPAPASQPAAVTEPPAVGAAPFDPLTSVKPMRGGPEYGELDQFLRAERPSCAGDDRFTADRIDDDTRRDLARICAGCPALALCVAYSAAGKPAAGYWPTTTAVESAVA
ncbi:hypothetical protein [Microbacterium arborescens]|uniref:hypothetical protein n=1 Tax=Microbacterium arborescens TaxID=33883 RepID=UPI002782E5AF|nr:hypothetical protein [Microbacterium arborescens]MDQ1217175.1 anti-sigma factor RsiW [Microbacterium arborescens]